MSAQSIVPQVGIADSDVSELLKNNNGIEDGTGDDFDAIGFANNILNTITNSRSKVAPDYDRLITSPTQLGSSSGGGESRVNSFYRLLGLPATRVEKGLAIVQAEKDGSVSISEAKDINHNLITADGTFNYFQADSATADSAFFSTAATELKKRNDDLTRKQKPEDYQNMLASPLQVNDSIVGVNGRKPSIFPPVVDAAIPIYPLNLRVAPAFYDGDYILPGGKERLSRPFIEHIIYMRTKAFSGAPNELKDQIKANIKVATGSDEFAKLPDRFTLIEGIIVNKFVQAMRQSASNYSEVIQQAIQLQSKVMFEMVPIENPNERSITPIPDDPKIGVTVIGSRIQDLNKRLSEQESLLISLPTEAVNQSDRIRRIEDDINISNIKADVFVSEFTGLISFERDKIERQMEDARAEEQQTIKALDQAKRDIILYSGEFTGLSIFDVLCTLYALFTIDVKYVIGLLNEDAKTRLKSDPFFSTSNQDVGGGTQTSDLASSSASITESINQLQNQTTIALGIAQGFFSNAVQNKVR